MRADWAVDLVGLVGSGDLEGWGLEGRERGGLEAPAELRPAAPPSGAGRPPGLPSCRCGAHCLLSCLSSDSLLLGPLAVLPLVLLLLRKWMCRPQPMLPGDFGGEAPVHRQPLLPSGLPALALVPGPRSCITKDVSARAVSACCAVLHACMWLSCPLPPAPELLNVHALSMQAHARQLLLLLLGLHQQVTICR